MVNMNLLKLIRLLEIIVKNNPNTNKPFSFIIKRNKCFKKYFKMNITLNT